MSKTNATKVARKVWKSASSKPSEMHIRYMKKRGFNVEEINMSNMRFSKGKILCKISSVATGKFSGFQEISISENKPVRKNYGIVKGGVYYSDVNTDTQHVNVVEGVEDAIALSLLGVKGTNCATLGASGMRKYVPPKDTKSVHFYPDTDLAGMEAASSATERLRSNDAVVNILSVPAGKDPNEYLLITNREKDVPKLPAQNRKKNVDLPYKGKAKSLLCSQMEFSTIYSMMNKEERPINWLIPSRIPEGLIVLAGKSKIGKSFLCLELALATAFGNKVLGKRVRKTGAVLLLSLEDNNRRMQSRFKMLGNNKKWSKEDRIHIYNDSSDVSFPKLGHGALLEFTKWCDNNPDCRLIIIDVLEQIRPKVKAGSNDYVAAYDDLKGLRKLANDRGITILVVAHTRKSNGLRTDPFENVLGTVGLVGVADATLVFQLTVDGHIELHGKGRDLPQFSRVVELKGAKWKVIGNVDEVSLSSTQKTVLKCMKKSNPNLLGPKDISKKCDFTQPNVQKALKVLCSKGLIRRNGHGSYSLSKL